MALEPPNLDDRRFQDIVDEMKRMIPRFTPEWTNHNVADPGVALIELFAWMSEMVLYRVNQVPDRLYTHFLNLVGVQPFPPSVARTHLTFWLSAPAAQDIVVPEGTEVSTVPGVDEEPVVFTTERAGVVRPPALVAARTGRSDVARTTDVWEDLSLPGAMVTCFGSAPVAAGDEFYLGMDTSLAGYGVRLDIVAHAEGVGIDPASPPVAWEVWTGTAWVPASVQSDSTGGLNKQGSVVLMMPQQHEQLVLDGVSAYWLRLRLLPVMPGQPTYQASPQLSSVAVRVVAVTVPAEHARRVPGEAVGRSVGVPGQVFQVSHSPVAARRPEEQVIVTDHTGDHVWSEVVDFGESGPRDRHVVWDSVTGELRFGPLIRQPDGTRLQCGAVPADGAQIRVSGYRTGAGADGNVGARTLTVLRSAIPFVALVSNLGPGTGGVDAETPDEAKIRGPLTLRTGNRAVTARDFEQIALQSSVEVARARCLPADGSGNGSVVVLVIPQVRGQLTEHRIDDFGLSSGLWQTVASALDKARLVGVRVEVGTPFYQGVSVAVLLRAAAGRPMEMVRQRVIEAISRFTHPLHGGHDGEGWPFGMSLNVTSVAQVIEGVDGVLGVDELQLFEYDLRTRQRVGQGREAIELPPRAVFLAADNRVVVT